MCVQLLQGSAVLHRQGAKWEMTEEWKRHLKSATCWWMGRALGSGQQVGLDSDWLTCNLNQPQDPNFLQWTKLTEILHLP